MDILSGDLLKEQKAVFLHCGVIDHHLEETRVTMPIVQEDIANGGTTRR
jgi:hypothetical protein